MKKNQVPQDDANLLQGKSRDLQYAIGEDGKYTTVKSVGWEPKNVVLQQTWQDINDDLQKIKELVKDEKYSPLYYHMKKHLLNKRMLAKYAGVSVFKVWFHIKPKGFSKLSNKDKEKYKKALNIPQEKDLSDIDS